MKFRTKWDVKISIVVVRIIIVLIVAIMSSTTWHHIDFKNPTYYISIGVIILLAIRLIYRYNNYILLDDIGITQVKCNLLFKKKVITIPYHEIGQIIIAKPSIFYWGSEIHVDDSISSTSGETIKIGRIFRLRKFKKILEEHKYEMTQADGYTKDIDGEKFSSSEGGGFVKLGDESMFISKNHEGTSETLNIKYQDIEQIEIVILGEYSDEDGCFYTKIKGHKYKEAFYGLNNCNAFMEALKKKGINAHFVSRDEIISDLKDEDLY